MKDKIKETISIKFLSGYSISRNPSFINDIKEILISNNNSFIPSLYDRIEIEGTLEEKVDYRIAGRLKNYHYIVAVLNDKIIGYTEFRTDDSLIYNKYHYCACVGTSAVHLDFQGYGIAKKLYTRLDELAEEFNVDAVLRSTWTLNSKQIKLYESFGYQEIERIENLRGQGNHSVKYCKWFK